MEPLTKDKNPRNWVPPHTSGEIITTVPVARVVVRWHGGSHVLPLHGRYFVGGTRAMYAKDALELIAYSQTGDQVARIHLG
jgi:hypothetical protein